MENFDFTKNYTKDEILEFLQGFRYKAVANPKARMDKRHGHHPESDKWRVTVTNPDGKTFSRNFFMGPLNYGKEPSLWQFMGAMIREAKSVEWVNAAGWAEESGIGYYDKEEIAYADMCYRQLERTLERLNEFLTPEQMYMFEEGYDQFCNR